jgi:hypothetical protein
MRRHGWQIGGLTIAIGAIVALGILVLAHGTTPVARHHALPSATASVTPTADPRVAEVEAAARRYVEALNNAMKTGSPDELDSLSVPGSQAEGNAGASAHVVHNRGLAFVVTEVTFQAITAEATDSAATATLDYTIVGFDAAWPSLQPRGSSQQIRRHAVFDFTRDGSAWLVDTIR